MNEGSMQRHFYEHPEALESSLRWLAQQHPVDFTKWLGVEVDQRASSDRYSNDLKKIDLVGVNEKGNLVLCELKCGGGNGDTGPFQVFEYWVALQHDPASLALLEASAHHPLLLATAELYIVIKGHLSRLLCKRIEMLRAIQPVSVSVFRAVPSEDSMAGSWTAERCLRF